jgi:glyoxylase-like metal-dependent hydrolase (beta-lactamase superfamily II)
VFTSPDDQFSVNSVIVEGDHEVMLVDAQLTKTSAEKVLEEIKETKKLLSIIYITHEHADHFLGLEVFMGAYPGVRIIATSAVVDRIDRVYREKLDKWQRSWDPAQAPRSLRSANSTTATLTLRAQGYRSSKISRRH